MDQLFGIRPRKQTKISAPTQQTMQLHSKAARLREFLLLARYTSKIGSLEKPSGMDLEYYMPACQGRI